MNCQPQEQHQPNGHPVVTVAGAGAGADTEAQQDVDPQADPRLGPYARQSSGYASWLPFSSSCSELVKWTGWELIEDHWTVATSPHCAEMIVSAGRGMLLPPMAMLHLVRQVLMTTQQLAQGPEPGLRELLLQQVRRMGPQLGTSVRVGTTFGSAGANHHTCIFLHPQAAMAWACNCVYQLHVGSRICVCLAQGWAHIEALHAQA